MMAILTSVEAGADRQTTQAQGAAPMRGLTPEQNHLVDKIPESVDYIDHESFLLPDAEEQFFGPDAERFEVPLWSPPSDPVKMLELAKKITLTAEQEIAMFLRFNYARYRLHLLVTTAQARSSPQLAGQMVMWHARALEERANLTRANLALVYAMLKRTSIAGVDSCELVSEGNMALLRSIDKFDVSRGCKFSTYACRSILKAFSRLAKRIWRRRKHLPMQTGWDPETHDIDSNQHERRRQESLETLREIFEKNEARLSDIEHTILTERFGLETGEKGRTLAEVARIVGLTDERVRQIQILALAKIRAAWGNTCCCRQVRPA